MQSRRRCGRLVGGEPIQSRRRCGRNGGWVGVLRSPDVATATRTPWQPTSVHMDVSVCVCVCVHACMRVCVCVCVRARVRAHHGRISHEGHTHCADTRNGLKQSPYRMSAAPRPLLARRSRGAHAALMQRSRGAHALRTSATALRAIATTQSIAFGWPSRACTSTASPGGDYIYKYTFARTRNHPWITVTTDMCGCRQTYVNGCIPAAAHYCIQI
jgi:hypothetical protein